MTRVFFFFKKKKNRPRFQGIIGVCSKMTRNLTPNSETYYRTVGKKFIDLPDSRINIL
jgi:hypothetical protein